MDSVHFCYPADVTTGRSAEEAHQTERRRRPRVEWVRSQSEHLSGLMRLPSARRNEALRTHGARAFHYRYRPLAELP